MQVLVPDSTGWMLLRNMVAARRYPNLAVSLTTAPSPVKSRGICFLAARATAVKTNPMAVDVVVATTTENLAAFGWLAPNSFETRTLTWNDTERVRTCGSPMVPSEFRNAGKLEKVPRSASNVGRYLTAALKPRATIRVQS